MDISEDPGGGRNNELEPNKRVNLIRYYSIGDKGPFCVYIESTDKSGNNIGKYNHLRIAKEIMNLNLNGVNKMEKKGLNRIAIEFKHFYEANNLVSNEELKNKGYNVFIPYNFVTCKGIVREVHSDMDLGEIKQNSKSIHQILDIIRLNRKNYNKDEKTMQYIPTSSILVTFQGVNLPREIHIYGLAMRVVPYIAPVTLCFKCLRYGHTKKNCKSKLRCYNCGSVENHEDSEKNFSCKSNCIHCKGDHRSAYRKCPEFERQKSIKRIMAFENLSYLDANSKCPKMYPTNYEEGYSMHPEDFPELRYPNRKTSLNSSNNFEENRNEINISQRRISQFNSGYKRSYQQVTSEPPKKKVINKGYDRKAHEQNLFFPNSRTPISYNSAVSREGNSQITNSEGNISSEEEIEPNKTSYRQTYRGHYSQSQRRDRDERDKYHILHNRYLRAVDSKENNGE